MSCNLVCYFKFVLLGKSKKQHRKTSHIFVYVAFDNTLSVIGPNVAQLVASEDGCQVQVQTPLRNGPCRRDKRVV